MSWRTIVITNKAKLSYKNNYLVIRNEEVKMIHLSEINTIIIDNNDVTITAYLVSEIIENKIKLIFVDAKRNPAGEVVPYYGSHNTSKKVLFQINWNEEIKKGLWTLIIKEKINAQSLLLKEYNISSYTKLEKYVSELTLYDETNREGHAAKVYFNSLFGKVFSRNQNNDINASLNYGYSILLSQFNKEIVGNGYLTQLGLKHCNEFNAFNLSSDLMEPFRPLIDKVVYDNKEMPFDSTMKLKLLDLLNSKVYIKNSHQFLTNAISIYVKSIFHALEKKDLTLVEFYKNEL